MSQVVKVYGASDDLIEFEGAVSDEFNAYDTDFWVGELVVENGDGLVVTAAYVHNGTWAIGVAPLDEDVFLPNWKITVGNADDNTYSAMLTIEIPDEAGKVKVKEIKK